MDWLEATPEDNRNLRSYHRNSTGPTYTTNYTITTSVSIRVTPLHDHFVSWGILWVGFLLASAVAAWQIVQEHRIWKNKKARRRRRGDEVSDDDDDDVEQGAGGDGESTADVTRSMFRKLLLLAMLARAILIPVQIWSWPIWWQFVGDTLPEMVFASAWTLLVTFFVQLVGVATGTGTNTSPGIVIQATAYVVYGGLIITQLVDMIASVLIYALLCVIYAALFGIVVYFCPRLLALLQPSLERHRGLAARLIVCTLLTIIVFAGHAVHYALLVVAPPKIVYWWWQYGALELLPSVVFLAMMNPNPSKGARNHLMDPEISGAKTSSHSSGSIRRVDSVPNNSNRRQPPETSALLLKPGSGYGAVDTPNPI